jgi:hypothetical protein
MSPSSRGLGHRPLTAVTGVRIPLGTPAVGRCRTPVCQTSVQPSALWRRRPPPQRARHRVSGMLISAVGNESTKNRGRLGSLGRWRRVSLPAVSPVISGRPRRPCTSTSSFGSLATTAPCSPTARSCALRRAISGSTRSARPKTLQERLQQHLVTPQAAGLRQPASLVCDLRPPAVQQGNVPDRPSYRVRQCRPLQPAFPPLWLPPGPQQDLQPPGRAGLRTHRAGAALSGNPLGLADLLAEGFMMPVSLVDWTVVLGIGGAGSARPSA